MNKRNYSLNFSAILLMILSYASISLAQPPNKPRNQKIEPKAEDYFKRFLYEDVPYIITAPELEAFKKLKTNEERENFITEFWRRRDPDPDTERNEYMEEYYERIAYANERFSSGIPGWKTDRGRVYITRGKPDSIDSHPSGGSYDRPSYEGGGSTTTYPFEVWFYRNVDGVGSGIEIEFVDPTGTGEYRIARNANEKDAMLMVPGAGQTLREMLGLETRADRIMGLNANYQRQQDTPFERLNIINGMMSAPKVSGVGTSIFNEPTPTFEDALAFDMRIDYFRQSDEKVFVTFTLQAKNKELIYKDIGGIQTAKMNIFGKITQISGKRATTFQDVVSTTATSEELAKDNFRSSIYQTGVPLTAGIYKTDVMIRDIETGKTAVRSVGFTVPNYENKSLSSSTLILASKLYQTTNKDIGGMFVIGDKKVVPNLSSEYKKGQEIGVYLQVYNAEINQLTLKPAVDVEYILTKDGKEISKQIEDWQGLSDLRERLVLAKFIQTDKLTKGEYELKIKIHDAVSNQIIEPKTKLIITE